MRFKDSFLFALYVVQQPVFSCSKCKSIFFSNVVKHWILSPNAKTKKETDISHTRIINIIVLFVTFARMQRQSHRQFFLNRPVIFPLLLLCKIGKTTTRLIDLCHMPDAGDLMVCSSFQL